MNNFEKLVMTFIVILLIPSCSTYQVRNLSNQSITPKHGTKCYNKYSISVTDSRYTNTFGTIQSNKEILGKLKNAYIESTNRVLNRNGCISTYTEDNSEAKLKICVAKTLYISALPQEWLTGLSLGLIPSWSTRPDQYTYTFEDAETKTKQSYAVDVTTYAHLFLIPWANDVNSDKRHEEFRVYEKTLKDYLDGL